MPDADYVRKVRDMDQAAVRSAWASISRGESLPGWPAGKAFEHVLLRQFEIEGAKVVWPYEVKLNGLVVEQIDGAIYMASTPFLVEAKDQRDPVDFAPIARLAGQLARRPPLTMGMVFSRCGFTEPAKTLARHWPPTRILLWGRDEMTLAIDHARMMPCLAAKYHMAIEKAQPDFDARSEEELWV